MEKMSLKSLTYVRKIRFSKWKMQQRTMEQAHIWAFHYRNCNISQVKSRVPARLIQLSLTSSMASSSGYQQAQDEFRTLIRTTVQEVLEQEKGKKGNKKKDKEPLVYDSTRRQGIDARDPRAQDSQWPCFNKHVVKRSGNRYGHWDECQRCGVRTMYEPEVTSGALTIKCDLLMNVTEAISRLRSAGWTSEDVTAKRVKSMIEIVARERAVMKPKTKASAKKSPEAFKTKEGKPLKNLDQLMREALGEPPRRSKKRSEKKSKKEPSSSSSSRTSSCSSQDKSFEKIDDAAPKGAKEE